MKDLTPDRSSLDPLATARTDEIQATQLERLTWTLLHAYDNVPHYRAAFDAAGVVRTDASERGLRIEWPDPLPVDVREQVASARAKRELGVPDERVLAELGYAATDPGIV